MFQKVKITSPQLTLTTCKKYKNLVKDQVPRRPEQLWVSDITYIKTQNGHNYLALVTDAYSKQIMGYKLDNHMRTSLCKDALAMAIKNRNALTKNSFIIPIEASRL
ncbi:DDE-type integrase/transposase/recombinase [Flavobacterium sp. CS20]|uniref:DDE-type integrase/transposase/recombinase n=1 Tax=Flavobacterium sp. CS20 TaxID=2775246 RepID=UPI001B3A0BD5|nr:DDE-type integrase/transposase/recombinase [Flavobacterium sp. CS20]QTY27809.1 DDE-type integrase/transposase/recombinase [Flavobacterium sp. CS20]